jgi:hypothetical protein
MHVRIGVFSGRCWFSGLDLHRRKKVYGLAMLSKIKNYYIITKEIIDKLGKKEAFTIFIINNPSFIFIIII